ncbi:MULTISPECIES: DUF4123 domain-containing protein [Thioclava]|uniref:DUF4123 domain-containing protein n=1 Tax=Thioclava litoralis TaxID=3076557 RepID=A0ABZ1E292_9RHOB|nr:DUF4123 domain-containing protein [Thioclava sp. FTW29]
MQIKDYVEFQTRRGVHPLDRQFACSEPKSAPSILLQNLFKDEASVYIVLDASKFVQGREVLEQTNGEYRCLFAGETAEDLEDLSPYLVRVASDDPLLRLLTTYDPALSPDWTTKHAQHREAAIFIRSFAGFEALWAHLRHFLRVRDAKGQWYFFRFWEPRFNKALARSGVSYGSLSYRLFSKDKLDALISYIEDEVVVATAQAISDSTPIRITESDFQVLRIMRASYFLERIKQSFRDDDEIWSEEYLDDNIEKIYCVALERGYRIEAANYLFMRASYRLAQFGLTIDHYENLVDPERIQSPLIRAKAIWANVEKDFLHA